MWRIRLIIFLFGLIEILIGIVLIFKNLGTLFIFTGILFLVSLGWKDIWSALTNGIWNREDDTK